MKTYDIINAGSHNRFMTNGKVVSNSGRLLQLQNLPQNHIETLEEARELVKMGCFDLVEMFYENTPDILSQLIRTMLVPKEGCVFIVADFSAIEARVLAWEAGEQWRLDTFKNGGDIYCASASQMFGVPVVKHGINGELRQKGKVAELACGYGGSSGALISMGALEMGLKESELSGLIEDWRNANPKIVQYWWDVEKAAIQTVKTHETTEVGKIKFSFSAHTLWMHLPSGRKLAYMAPKMQPNRFGRMAITFLGVGTNNKWCRQETYSGKLVENCITKGTLVMTGRGLTAIEDIKADDLIWDGEEWVHHEGLIEKGVQPTVSVNGIHMTADHKILTQDGWCRSGKSQGFIWAEVRFPDGAVSESDYDDRITVHSTGFSERVYDIRNCGPRHRFAVYEPGTGKLRIVSNCTQAIARDILAEAMWRMEQAGLEIVGSVHDEVIIEAPKGNYTVEEVCELMSQNPKWCEDLPLNAAGYLAPHFYFKD